MKEATVVGAGVVGLCSAHALLERGYRVTVLEREPEGHRGCSYGNGGMIVPSHFVPLAAPGMIGLGLRLLPRKAGPFGFTLPPSWETVAWSARFMRSANRAHVERSARLLRDLNVASRDEYARLADELGDVAFERRGLLMLCRTQAALDAEAHMVEDAAKLDLHAEVLDERGLREVEPGIRMDVKGGVIFHDDAHLSPDLFMAAMRRRIREMGGEIRDGAEVTEIPSGLTILAAGAWTGRLVKQVGIRMPMLSGRGYGFTVPHPPESPSIPSILIEGRIAVTPMPDGLRFVGTMELGPPGEERINEARIEGIRRAIPEYYPAFRDVELRRLTLWTGQRPCSPDGLPYLGRRENVIVAAGHSMMGMSLGPITGKLVGELADGETPSIPIDLLRPERYN